MLIPRSRSRTPPPSGAMRIEVKNMTGASIMLDARLSDTIDTVKEKIQATFNVPAAQQRLSYDNHVLEDGRKLSHYQIRHKSLLTMVVRAPPTQIFVKTSRRKTITLDVVSSDTIESVKERVEAMAGIFADQQRLFAVAPLENKRTLAELGIEQGQTLHLGTGAYSSMQIFVKTLIDTEIPLMVECTETVDDVKQKVADKEGIDFTSFDLTFEGSECIGNEPMWALKVEEDDVFQMTGTLF